MQVSTAVYNRSVKLQRFYWNQQPGRPAKIYLPDSHICQSQNIYMYHATSCVECTLSVTQGLMCTNIRQFHVPLTDYLLRPRNVCVEIFIRKLNRRGIVQMGLSIHFKLTCLRNKKIHSWLSSLFKTTGEKR